MWLAWKWIGLGLMIIVYFLLVYWQRKRWFSPATEIGIIVITMMFFDWLMTWLGQPVLYWQSVVQLTNEFNPIGRFLLNQHPMVYAAGFIFYMIIIVILIRVLCRYSRFLMIVVSSILVVGHGYCALQWLVNPDANTHHILPEWAINRIDDIPFSYLPFIIIGLLVGILLIRRKRKNF